MKKHSEPVMYVFIGTITMVFGFIFILSGGKFNGVIVAYLFAGFIIWFPLLGAESSFWKTVLFWYPAILLDHNEWIIK